jgi:folate-binding protein YgfZ
MTIEPTSPALTRSATLAYEAARAHAIVVDLSRRGRVRVTGKDRVDLLQRLTTNDMKSIAPGEGITNLFLTNKGRIFELCDILAFPDHLLLLLASEEATRTAEWIERYVFMEDVVAADVTAETSLFGIFGPQAGAAIQASAGMESGTITGRDHQAAVIGGANVVVGGAEPIAGAGFRVLGTRTDAAAIESALLAAGASAGVRRANLDALEILRIEAGWPAAGHELTEHWNPLEADLRWAVSYTKGCYTGQEVVARLTTYKKVQHTVRGLKISGSAVPGPESKVRRGEAEVGQITSAAWSPGVQSVIALAYLDLAASTPGTTLAVEVAPGQTAVAEVTPLPFPESGLTARAEDRGCA